MAYPVAGTRVAVAVGGLAAALNAASSGNVLVLAEGTHTLASGDTVPNGVSLRGVGGAEATTILDSPLLSLGSACSIRDLTVTPASSSAFVTNSGGYFDNVTFNRCKVVDCSALSNGPAAGFALVFNRCTFLVGTGAPINLGLNSTGDVQWKSCLFANPDGNTPTLIRSGDYTASTVGMEYIFQNCTFSNPLSAVAWNHIDTGASGLVYFYNCLADTPLAFPIGIFKDYSGHASGAECYCAGLADDPALPAFVTRIADAHLHALSYAPTSRSAFRNNGTGTNAADVDRAFHLIDAPGTTAGCYQWRGEQSTIYRPRFLDPVSGLSIAYVSTDGNGTLNTTSADASFLSHQDVMGAVRQYIFDLIHPVRCEFYTTYDGRPRLTVNLGTFTLTTSGDAAILFGNQSTGSVSDTG